MCNRWSELLGYEAVQMNKKITERFWVLSQMKKSIRL